MIYVSAFYDIFIELNQLKKSYEIECLIFEASKINKINEHSQDKVILLSSSHHNTILYTLLYSMLSNML